MTALPHDAAGHGHDAHAHAHGSELPSILRGENVAFPPGAGKGISTTLLVLGALLLGVGAACGYLGVGGVWARQATAAYMVGVFSVLAICLGATFFVMVFTLVNAGWWATLKRQFENLMSLLPVMWVMLLPILIVELAVGGHLFTWMNDANADDYLLIKKSTYFFFPLSVADGVSPFPVFFVLRTLFYGFFWWWVTRRLVALSKAQDQSGDPALTAQARFTCAWALPVFALTIAFCAFDYLMALDFKFFSTMWGVYYFAGAAFSSVAMLTLIFNWLLRKQKMQGLATSEHFHDLGKLQFSFTVFWAYISFSQYFLIWYANIPEETAFFIHRKDHGWMGLGVFLIIGHFVAPFLILISRHVKKHLGIMLFMSTFCLIAHVADMYWIIRPMVYMPEVSPDGPVATGPGVIAGYLDALMIAGVLAVFVGLVVRKVASGPLVAVRDPYMAESLEHKNYV